jgi:hypothetical protein
MMPEHHDQADGKRADARKPIECAMCYFKMYRPSSGGPKQHP